MNKQIKIVFLAVVACLFVAQDAQAAHGIERPPSRENAVEVRYAIKNNSSSKITVTVKYKAYGYGLSNEKQYLVKAKRSQPIKIDSRDTIVSVEVKGYEQPFVVEEHPEAYEAGSFIYNNKPNKNISFLPDASS